MTKSPIERLQETNPMAEIWWDSSPLVFSKWRNEMLSAAEPESLASLEAELDRLMPEAGGSSGGFRGCTTNPPLSLTAVTSDPDFWETRIDELHAQYPDLSATKLAWAVYKDVIERGAEAFRGQWEATGGRYGYVSGQLDPRLFTEIDTMVDQAREIAGIAPNVMIKVPASAEGIEVLRTLTSEGISTNVTTSFTVPQVMAAANATIEGLEAAVANGVDLSKWRAVITLMLARLTERPIIREQAAYAGVNVSAADLKWFGLAVFKRAYQLLRDGGYPSKLLLCSVRPGPKTAGRLAFWDIEELCGGDIVYTLPPGALTPLFDRRDFLVIDSTAIDRPVPRESLDKILQLPYGLQSYEPSGMSPDQFNLHPATLFTVEEFSKSASGLEDYVRARLTARDLVVAEMCS